MYGEERGREGREGALSGSKLDLSSLKRAISFCHRQAGERKERAGCKLHSCLGGLGKGRLQKDKRSIDGSPLKATIVKGFGVREPGAKEAC